MPAATDFALPNWPFALIAASAALLLTALMLCINMPAKGARRARLGTCGALMFLALCALAVVAAAGP